MAWTLWFVAPLLEVVWAYSMQLSEGFTRVIPIDFTLITMAASFGLLSVAMKVPPLGTAHTIWRGIGAIGAFLAGIAALGEPLTAALIASCLILMKSASWGSGCLNQGSICRR
jgi:quaternary ammonium compound-resistance protein SugE